MAVDAVGKVGRGRGRDRAWEKTWILKRVQDDGVEEEILRLRLRMTVNT